jgi:hypothetical protein
MIGAPGPPGAHEAASYYVVSAMSFPKPSFDALLANYETTPASVHECSLYHKDPMTHEVSLNTCAIRMGEALVLANGLVENREAITALAKGGDGRSFLLGLHDYPALLCPHGISRGAGDLASFLHRTWGAPDKTWTAQEADDSVPDDARGLRGIIAFEGIPNLKVQGHVDLWNEDSPVGHQFWSSKKIELWVVGGRSGSAKPAESEDEAVGKLLLGV